MSNTHGKKQSAAAKAGAFSLTFVMLFAITYGFLAVVDVLPEPADRVISDTKAPSHTVTVITSLAENPVRISAMDISLDATIANPTSTNVEALDTLLLKGAVRNPTSAKLGLDGLVLLFG